MRVPLKAAVITGEVTVLVACTAVGVHLFMQPYRFPQAAPPLVLPSAHSHVQPLPILEAPAADQPSPTPRPSPSDLTPGWMAQLDRDDRTRVKTEWDILQLLTRSVVRYLEQRVIPAMEGRS
jgi:hypothetical protein